MAYTGQLPKDMIITEPTIGTARVNELDDAIRQVKSAMFYGYDNTVFGSGNAAIATGVASYVRTGAGTAYITLPQISIVAGAAAQRKITIFNDTSTSGSGGSLTVSAYAGDTIATLVDLWQNESVVLIATTTDNEWKVQSNISAEHLGIDVITAESLTDGTNIIHTKIINIGDWNMDTTTTISIAHGLTLTKIRSVSVMVINDLGDSFNQLEADGNGYSNGYISYIDATYIVLGRLLSGNFDNIFYDSTSYNRGWITIIYVE